MIPAANFFMLVAPQMSVLDGLKPRRPVRTRIGIIQPFISISRMGVRNTLKQETSDISISPSLTNTGIPGVPRVLGPVSELWDGSLNSGVGTPEFWGTSDAFCVVLA